MMAAIHASGDDTLVEIYERNDRVGKKLLATGNGKCNFSNTDMSKEAYYGSAVSFYDKLYSEFGVAQTVDFFSQSGMLIKDRNGYLYPASEQASTVLNVLRIELERRNVRIHTESKVERIEKDNKGGSFRIITAGNKSAEGNDLSKGAGKCLNKNADKGAYYDAVILACGGKAASSTGSDGLGIKLAEALGHHATPIVPALVQLRCREDFFKSIAGVRTQARLTLNIDGASVCSIQGELQLTDYGISGIPVFCFSREAAYALLHNKKVTVDIDFLPQFDDGYESFFNERWIRRSDLELEQFLTGIANKKINQLIIKLAGCKPNEIAEAVSKEKRAVLERLYRKLTVSISATNGFEHAQVSAGGIPANELTYELESKLVSGLYFAGEIIDIDGICGGYNLQWAWTSGAIAGRAARKTV